MASSMEMNLSSAQRWSTRSTVSLVQHQLGDDDAPPILVVKGHPWTASLPGAQPSAWLLRSSWRTIFFKLRIFVLRRKQFYGLHAGTGHTPTQEYCSSYTFFKKEMF